MPGANREEMTGPGPAAVRAARGPLLLAWALAGGVLAGLASWLGGEQVHGRFQPEIVGSPEYEQMNVYEKENYRVTEFRRLRPAAEAKNAALAFGMLGAALGAALGLGGGLARGAARSGLVAGAVGAVVGLAAAAAASALAVPLFYRYLDPEFGGLLVPTLTHGLVLACLGAAGGLALGMGAGGRRQIVAAVVGGIVGGIVATVAYELILAVLFPLIRVEEPIPTERLARAVMHLTAAVGIAAGAAMALQGRRRGPGSPRRSR
jgi:hypothetical protein